MHGPGVGQNDGAPPSSSLLAMAPFHQSRQYNGLSTLLFSARIEQDAVAFSVASRYEALILRPEAGLFLLCSPCYSD